jgi:hypothetical protein
MSVRASLGHHYPRGDIARVPIALSGDPRREPHLAIDNSQQFMNVHQLGLHLDNQQRPAGSIPGENVYPASFGADRKRHLWRYIPAPGRKELDDGTGKRGMALVQEPVQFAATPSRDDIDANVQCASEATERVERHAANTAALEIRNHRSRYTCSIGDIHLPPSLTNSDRPKCRTNS